MKLSIITINFNNAAGLQKTIDSVVMQSYTDYEYIIIDGGSTDGSVDVIKRYADKIAYWVSERDKGIYNACNKGILQAKGEYCLFLHSEDVLLQPDGLEHVFSQNPSEDIVYCDVDRSIGVKIHPDKLTLLFFFKSTINHQSVFIRRSLFSTYGLYKEDYKHFSDKDFYLKALIKGQCSYRHIPYILIRYDMGGVSRNPLYAESMEFEREDVLKVHFPMMYDDYQELLSLQKELKSLTSSRLIRLIRKLSRVFQKIKRKFL
jgi:glycosyltransferase involved in cell wall biosynthesis